MAAQVCRSTISVYRTQCLNATPYAALIDAASPRYTAETAQVVAAWVIPYRTMEINHATTDNNPEKSPPRRKHAYQFACHTAAVLRSSQRSLQPEASRVRQKARTAIGKSER